MNSRSTRAMWLPKPTTKCRHAPKTSVLSLRFIVSTTAPCRYNWNALRIRDRRQGGCTYPGSLPNRAHKTPCHSPYVLRYKLKSKSVFSLFVYWSFSKYSFFCLFLCTSFINVNKINRQSNSNFTSKFLFDIIDMKMLHTLLHSLSTISIYQW